MYDELVKALRGFEDYDGLDFLENRTYAQDIAREAADAIEELRKDRDDWKVTAKEEREAYWHWFEQYQKDVPRWIPVTERLPKIKEHHVSDDVIVFFSDGGMGFSALEENCFGQTWFECERCNPDGEIGCEVTHWMPLPTPPEEET